MVDQCFIKRMVKYTFKTGSSDCFFETLGEEHKKAYAILLINSLTNALAKNITPFNVCDIIDGLYKHNQVELAFKLINSITDERLCYICSHLISLCNTKEELIALQKNYKTKIGNHYKNRHILNNVIYGGLNPFDINLIELGDDISLTQIELKQIINKLYMYGSNKVKVFPENVTSKLTAASWKSLAKSRPNLKDCPHCFLALLENVTK